MKVIQTTVADTNDISDMFRTMLLSYPRSEGASSSNMTEVTANALVKCLSEHGALGRNSVGQPTVTVHSLAEMMKALVKQYPNEISDGSHTFLELYDHRSILFCALLKMISENGASELGIQEAWYSHKHSDGTMFDNYMIVGISTDLGSCTYHVRKDPFDNLLKRSFVKELPNAPQWDGHTSHDVLDRLTKLFF